jgi:hypothetical protein
MLEADHEAHYTVRDLELVDLDIEAGQKHLDNCRQRRERIVAWLNREAVQTKGVVIE